MSAIRRAAWRLLNRMAQQATPETRTWGSAMLREMDFVEGNWEALLWALGSIMVLGRNSISRGLRSWFDRNFIGRSSRTMTARITSLASGILIGAAVLAVCIVAFVSLVHASWFEPAYGKLADRLLIVVVPETIYLAGALALWRQRKPMAVGVLVAGVILIAHAAMHFITHR